MKTTTVDRYRAELTGAIRDLPVTHARRHDAITRELGSFANYRRWTEALRDGWDAGHAPALQAGPARPE